MKLKRNRKKKREKRKDKKKRKERKQKNGKKRKRYIRIRCFFKSRVGNGKIYEELLSD